jgi:hypothetical protein
MTRRLFLSFLGCVISIFIGTETSVASERSVRGANIVNDENGMQYYTIADICITINKNTGDISVTKNEILFFSRQINDDGTKTYFYFDSDVEENDERRTISYSTASVIIHKNRNEMIEVRLGNIPLITQQ